MEWSKAKSLLILLMLAVNIYLGVNIYTQLRAEAVQEEEMVRDACTILKQQGITVAEEVSEALPFGLQSHTWVRDIEAERQAALRLLGECHEDQPGGGIYTYNGTEGAITFRSGGYVELLENDGADLDLKRLLLPQGEESRLTLMQQDGGFALCFDGYAVLGAGVGKGEGETWSGTWIFASASQPGEESLSRAQLILSAGRLLEKSGYTELKGITCVYLLTSLQSGDIRLLPALLLDTGSEQLCMNALTGEAALLPQK